MPNCLLDAALPQTGLGRGGLKGNSVKICTLTPFFSDPNFLTPFFLARRWAVPIGITRQIAEGAMGNVRAAMAAMADLEMWLG